MTHKDHRRLFLDIILDLAHSINIPDDRIHYDFIRSYIDSREYINRSKLFETLNYLRDLNYHNELIIMFLFKCLSCINSICRNGSTSYKKLPLSVELYLIDNNLDKIIKINKRGLDVGSDPSVMFSRECYDALSDGVREQIEPFVSVDMPDYQPKFTMSFAIMMKNQEYLKEVYDEPEDEIFNSAISFIAFFKHVLSNMTIKSKKSRT